MSSIFIDGMGEYGGFIMFLFYPKHGGEGDIRGGRKRNRLHSMLMSKMKSSKREGQILNRENFPPGERK